jgi:hypothetical protein
MKFLCGSRLRAGLGKPTPTLVPCWSLNPCLQGTSVGAGLPQPCGLCSSSSDLDWGSAPNVCSCEAVYVLVCYMVTPILVFCNAYGCGLTDWCLASTYGKLGLFIVVAWAGSNGSVMARFSCMWGYYDCSFDNI